MPSSLPSVEDLADYLRVVETAVDDYDVLDGVRLYTQSLIRKVTGRTWTVASGSASTRVYAPRAVGQDLIRIHDCVTVTSVTNDGVTVPAWMTAGGYQLEPLNGLDWAGETRPYEGIRYIGNAWTFDRFRATVAVTADWGWAALPDQVVRTHYVIAKDVWEFRSQQGNAGMDEFLENKAKMLLKGYRREEAKAGIGGPR